MQEKDVLITKVLINTMKHDAFSSKSILSVSLSVVIHVPGDQNALFCKTPVKMVLNEFDSQFHVSVHGRAGEIEN